MGKVSGFVLPVIMALVVLVYTTLAALTLTTARADDKFANRNIEFNKSYYSAEADFAKDYAVLDELLTTWNFREAADRAQGEEAIANKLENIEIITEGTDFIEFEYQTRISENIVYMANMMYHFSGGLEIEAQGIQNVAEWEDEEDYEVWDG